MIAIPFLTKLDSRAAIKGSRDPLGFQPIWSRLGRQVVGNLTTVTTSVQDFTVLLLGYYFTERVAAAEGNVGTFLKWEQLAAYARTRIPNQPGFRGTDRVKSRLADSQRVTLGLGDESQILSDQKTYGLWGLYSNPAKASGLLEGDPARLTAPARRLVEKQLLPVIERHGAKIISGIIDRIAANKCDLDLGKRSDAAVLDGIAEALTRVNAAQRDLYREHLLHGGPQDGSPNGGTCGRQQLLANLLTETLDDDSWTLNPLTVKDLAQRARRKGEVGDALADCLDRIRIAEGLLALMAALFERILDCNGQSLETVTKAIKRNWGSAPRGTIDLDGLRRMEHALCSPAEDAESGHRCVQIAEALHHGTYQDVIRGVLKHHASVMKVRSAAAPWADEHEGQIRIRFGDHQGDDLPNAEDLQSYWRHAYFIASVRDVAAGLRGAS